MRFFVLHNLIDYNFLYSDILILIDGTSTFLSGVYVESYVTLSLEMFLDIYIALMEIIYDHTLNESPNLLPPCMCLSTITHK